jgi:hypothetical protein
VPETHRHVSKVIQECNWLEGGLDTSHAPILHRLLKDNAGRGGIKPSNPIEYIDRFGLLGPQMTVGHGAMVCG